MNDSILDRILTNYYKKHPKSLREQLMTEDDYRNLLQCIIGGRKEVKTPLGNIDLLTDDLIVEVKKSSCHRDKQAIGQVLVYSAYYPNHTKVVALIGRPEQTRVNEICEDLGIIYMIFWNNRWMVPYAR